MREEIIYNERRRINPAPAKDHSSAHKSFFRLFPIAILIPNLLENGVLPIHRHPNNLLENPLNPQALPAIRTMTIPNAQDVLAIFNAEGDAGDFVVAKVAECIAYESEEELFPQTGGEVLAEMGRPFSATEMGRVFPSRGYRVTEQ